jgi:hypothetical protein
MDSLKPTHPDPCPPRTEPAIDESVIQGHPELIAKGWVRRNLADPERAGETMDLYRSMGFEVRAEKLSPEDFGAKCLACALAVCSTYVLIYTRKMPS